MPSIPAINIDSGVVTQSSYVKRASPDGSQPRWDLESLTSHLPTGAEFVASEDRRGGGSPDPSMGTEGLCLCLLYMV